MKIHRLEIEGVLLLEPAVFEDERGYFFESFNKQKFEEATGIEADFVQDNESMSNRGVIRGLHLQESPHAQAKLVRVVRGAVLDVAVDLRQGSPTYGRYISAELSSTNKLQLYIPPGFAHGFAVLEDNTVFSYKCSEYYNRECERAIQWNDPDINIDWVISNPILSEKDRFNSVSLRSYNSPFRYV